MYVHSLFKNISTKLRWFLAAGAVALTAGSALAQTVQGVSDTEILIGSHQDLSGPIASTGAPIRELMQFAVDDVNAAGGIHGRKLRLIVEDSSYDTKKAVLATQKLLTQDKVFALVATLGSPTSLASMPLAIDRGIPFLFPAAASDSGYLPFHPLKFGLMTPYSDQTRAAVKFAYDKLGKRRFGVLYQDDDNGQNLLQALVSELKTLGMAPIEATNFKRGEFEFSAQIARLKAADVDVIILGTSGARDTAGAAIETKKLGWNVDMIAGVGASNETVIRLGGKAVEGLYATFQFLNSTQPMTPALRTALDRFKTRYGHDAGDGMLGYNAVMLFAEGAKNAGRNLTPQTLTQGLEKIKNFTTVFAGPAFTYGPGNHNPPNTPIMMKVKDGKYVPVL